MSVDNRTDLVLSFENIDINEKDLECLKPSTFVNDNIINFYLKYIYRCMLNENQRQKVHIFDSFFCEALDQMDEARVRRWLRRVNIFEKEFLLVPAMIDEHWFLIVIRSPGGILTRIDANGSSNNSHNHNSYRTHRGRPSISIMDSAPDHVRDKKPQLIQYLCNFIRIACSVKGKTVRVEDLFDIMPSRECDVKIQTNNYDCGLHLLANAENFLMNTYEIPNATDPEIEFRLADARRKRDSLKKFIRKLAEAMEIERAAKDRTIA